LNAYKSLIQQLSQKPRVWLITGAAGFIGSHLVETLLHLNQKVIGVDNFATGSRLNLDQVRNSVGPALWENVHPIEGDIRDPEICKRACDGVDYILHQAGLGSVPRSIANPQDSHASNVTGFLNMLVAGRDAGVKRMVYASSSSVYGDHPALPKQEQNIGSCLSPYAATKRVNELYADVFARCYGLQSVGLRYFNVFGARQDPNGPYAAVIPQWVTALIRDEPVYINGDGETSRDFCYVANVVQANLLAATVENPEAVNQVYNVAVSTRTTLNQLYEHLRANLLPWFSHLHAHRPVYREFRRGDVRHSEADTSKAERLLGYRASHTLAQGLEEALPWYRQHFGSVEQVIRVSIPPLRSQGLAIRTRSGLKQPRQHGQAVNPKRPKADREIGLRPERGLEQDLTI